MLTPVVDLNMPYYPSAEMEIAVVSGPIADLPMIKWLVGFKSNVRNLIVHHFLAQGPTPRSPNINSHQEFPQFPQQMWRPW